jgi:hypothetical protein
MLNVYGGTGLHIDQVDFNDGTPVLDNVTLFTDLIKAWEIENSETDGDRTYPVNRLIKAAIVDFDLDKLHVQRLSTAANFIVRGELDD